MSNKTNKRGSFLFQVLNSRLPNRQVEFFFFKKKGQTIIPSDTSPFDEPDF